MLFSIIIPTRNRPELFANALESVLAQGFSDYEIIVVVDGSDSSSLSEYHDLAELYQSRARFFHLINRDKGHGQSYSMNHGASLAKGDFLCFLDDDDFWIESRHLQNAANTINSVSSLDLYYTNQFAYYSDGERQLDHVWIEDLSGLLHLDVEKGSCVKLTRAQILSSKGFPHLNCSIIRRSLYLSIGGMDENIRYECDRDLFLRCIDGADNIYYCPDYVSQHHIPDQTKKDNMSTSVSIYEKSLYQASVYQKAILLLESAVIQRHAIKNLSYVYKWIAHTANGQHEPRRAFLYAKQALALKFGLKWFLYTLWLAMKAVRSDR